MNIPSMPAGNRDKIMARDPRATDADLRRIVENTDNSEAREIAKQRLVARRKASRVLDR